MNELEGTGELILGSVNRRLAELLGSEPMPLSCGGARSLEDRLWIWGIVGGKEVGKSTLINALAGGDVVDPGQAAGEGTSQPAAYLAAEDLAVARRRFAGLESASIAYHAVAPDTMRRLIIVDLPDFDSLFERHADTVRDIAGVLDGIIWVTTPKKVGDLRAIGEIRRVLKARTNFVYVVNKMDWLLAQSSLPPQQELDRAAAALAVQVSECDPDELNNRAFFIAAKYTSRESMLEAIARSRGPQSPADGGAGSGANGTLADAVMVLLRSFRSLKTTLTTSPTTESATAGKRENLSYQLRTQARRLLEHFRPHALLQRLERVTSRDTLDEAAQRFIPHAFCAGVVRQLNSGRGLSAEWSTTLFRKRISHWPVLGIVAWPVALMGSLVAGLQASSTGNATGDDPFRRDGLSLDERLDGLLTGIRARLAGLTDQLRIELPAAEPLERQFRADVGAIVAEDRAAVIGRHLDKRPGLLGRTLRWVLPVAVLLWFPLLQPVLAAMLAGLNQGLSFNAGSALMLVEALSGAKVLAGLAVSLLILAGITAAVYSRAVRDAYQAQELLREAAADVVIEPLHSSLLSAVIHPVEQIRSQLSQLTQKLERMCNGDPSEPPDAPDRPEP